MRRTAKQLGLRLADALVPRERVLTAYSGGIDSTLVAAVARQTLGRHNAPAAIGDSRSLPRRELDDARAVARKIDLELIEVVPAEQDDARYRANAHDRCYYCKTNLYASLHRLADELGIPYIANGTNADDLGDHRPGLRAAAESKVVSPLLEAEMTKADIRSLAAYMGLPNADKPAAACLASRVPFGTPVTPERLAAVESAENALHDLGFTSFRIRHHETVARIELPPDQWPRLLEETTRRNVIARLNDAGFIFVALDIAGFQSGSGNKTLVALTAGSIRVSD